MTTSNRQLSRGCAAGMSAAAVVVCLIGAQLAVAAAPAVFRPYETTPPKDASSNPIDPLVAAVLDRHNIPPANLCSDEVFIRRVYLDVTGSLPQADAVRRFLNATDSAKRADLIDALLDSEEYADYWALKWCDILRVKAEFPINLWPNAAQAYHRWIRQAIRDNMPYDRFARELLTSSGSNFRTPPVNFYRAIQEQTPAAIASAVALTFMGTRLDAWPQDRQEQLEAFFSRVAYKSTAEWKEEIVYLKPDAEGPLKAVLPDGTPVVIAAHEDPRVVFADWLIRPDNPNFTAPVVNRIWAWLFGRGIVNEADDIRPDNPPVNPELLTLLQKELASAKFDLKHIYRLILNSRTYQQSSIPRAKHPDAESLFAVYPVRRLDAEILIDNLCGISGTQESYSSLIPEPFTFIPEEHDTVSLADGSISSQFLEMFGRPARDSGLLSERNNQPTDSQRLHLLNSSHIQRKIENSPKFRNLLRNASKNPRALIGSIYLTVLSRYPTREELTVVEEYIKTPGVNAQQAAADTIWALINSKEFLYRH